MDPVTVYSLMGGWVLSLLVSALLITNIYLTVEETDE